MMKFKRYVLRLLQTHPRFQFPFYRLKTIVSSASLKSPYYSSSCMEENILFVVGSGRSGNTLLRKLLMENLDIYIPPETYVVPSLLIESFRCSNRTWSESVDRIIEKIQQHPEFATFNVTSLQDFALRVKKWPKKMQNIASVIREFYCWHGEQLSTQFSWVGDKTPLNTLYLGIIYKAFPRAKFLYISRDGLDVTYSYVESGIYNSYLEASDRWVRSVISWNNFRKNLDSSSYLEINYESLVINPKQILQKISNSLGLPMRKEKVCIDNILGDVSKRKHHANVALPISDKYIGKGRKYLTNSNQCLSSKLNKCLELSGYEKLRK